VKDTRDIEGDPITLQTLVAELHQQIGHAACYVFWNTQPDGSPTPEHDTQRPRTLLAFPNPDAALAFAQHNQMANAGRPPRLRHLTLTQILQAMLRKTTIATLILVDADVPWPAPGFLPVGVVLTRAALLVRLRSV
jgi:hypothetical protein